MNAQKVMKLTFISLVISTILQAQEVKSKKLDSITVTANKIEENIQDVPQAITVMDETVIQEKSLDTVEKILNQIPNMNVMTSNGNGSYMNYRGLNTSTFTYANPVVIFVDGVPTSNIYGYEALIENIERVEVLRGPQGTLYGKDAIGAVVNIVTKEPTNETSGSINAEYGSDGYMAGRFHVNGPITKDKLYFGLASELKSDDGWATNTYNNDDKSNKSESRSLDGFLLYKATENLSFKLGSQNTKSKVYGFDGVPNLDFSTYLNTNPMTPPDSPATAINPKRSDAEKQYFEHSQKTEVITNSQSLNINYTFNNLDFTSVTVNKKSITDSLSDSTYLYRPLFGGAVEYASGLNNTEIKSFSQEFRLAGTNNDIKWLTGLYYEDEDIQYGPKYGGETYFYSWTGMPTMIESLDAKLDSKTYAVFGQAVIPFFKDFELTLGGRYQKIKKEIDLDKSNSLRGAFSRMEEKSWTKFLPKLALSYKINENYMAYLSYAHGYMPGGLNFYPDSVNTKLDFEPQTSKNYELGLKASFENGSFGINVFRMDIKDIHLFTATSALDFFTINAKKAYSQGIELDGVWYPNENWEISGSIGIIDAKYDDDNIVHAGKTINSIPKYNANLGIAYSHPDGFYARGDVNFIGKTYYHDDGHPMFGLSTGWVETDPYITANLKLGYKYEDFDFYVYSTNITNEDYVTWQQRAFTTFGDPRFIGAGLRYSF